jgi:hypothetical protein
MSERPIEHRFKTGRRHTGRVCRLHEGVLRCDAGGDHREMAVGDIAAIHLTFEPTRFDFDDYVCFVQAKGHPTEVIHSIWDAGLAKGEDHAGTYTPFVRQLVAEVAEANAAARFRTGEPGPRYLVELSGLVILFVLLIAAAYMLLDIWDLAAVVMVMVTIVALPFAVRRVIRNWPRSFDPNDIPARLLPPVPERLHSRH